MGQTKVQVFGEEDQEKKSKKKQPEKKDKGIKLSGLKGGERVVAIESEAIPQESDQTEADAKKKKEPRKRGKKYQAAAAKVDKSKKYNLAEAIKLAKEISTTSFDPTLELHLIVKKVGFSCKAELPHSTGKAKKVEVTDDKTIEKLKKGKIDFDVLLATADMMPQLVPFAKDLGPKGLMPNPKAGTLIKSKEDAKKFSSSGIQIKTEKSAPVIHTVLGKLSQKESELEDNTKVIIEAIGANQILKAYICSSMSPSIKLDL